MSEFREIIAKYHLEHKADEIVEFLFSKSVTSEEFADKFNIDEKDAAVVLHTIKRAIDYKEKHLDKK